MAQLDTRRGGASVEAFLDSVAEEPRREDRRALLTSPAAVPASPPGS